METSSSDQNIIAQILTDLKHIIFNLTEKNFDLSIQQTMNLFDSNSPYSFDVIICIFVLSAFSSLRNESDIYIRYLQSIQSKEEELNKDNPKIIEIFIKYIAQLQTQEAYYFLEQMITHNFVDSSITKNMDTNYFIHYRSKSVTDINSVSYKDVYALSFLENFSKISMNDFELHRKYVKIGHNPSEIGEIIRNDEIEKLQELSSQEDFDINQIIEPSLYERCSFINQNNVSLIDYAAFFSAVKCFKYLLMKNANVNKTGKYAVAGGNDEIIHLCEQHHSSFEGAYEAAIKFHRNDLFYYIYENNLEEFDGFVQPNPRMNRNTDQFLRLIMNNHIHGTNFLQLMENLNPLDNNQIPQNLNDKIINKLVDECIHNGNYEILLFLEDKEIEIKESIINETAKFGNLYLIKHFLQKNTIPKNILLFATQSGNNELVQFILEQKDFEIDLNIKEDGKTPLMIATEKGYEKIVKLLLEQNGIEINVKDHDGNTLLIKASIKGNIEIIKMLLEQEGIDINAKNNDKYTALMKASENGHIEIVKLLLKQNGIEINIKNNAGETAYILATKCGYIEIAKLLHELGNNDINFKTEGGKTTLMLASRNGHLDVVKFLLKQGGFDINEKDKAGWTALMLASANGHYEIVKLLLEQKGININYQNYGETALIEAVKCNSSDIVKLLLKQEGIDINAKDIYGITALMIASKKGFLDIVKMLIEQKGINVNDKDIYGNTAFLYSCGNGHTEIVKLLLQQKGTNVNDKKSDGSTALMNASKFGYIEIVKLLLEQEGININAKKDDGYSALILASLNGYAEIVKLLLEQEGIDINAKEDDGNTALILASQCGHTEIVKLLLEQEGNNINAQTYSGWNTLMFACSAGNNEIVELILEHKGIDINAKNNEGQTALMLASYANRLKAVKLLLEQEGIDINAKDNNDETAFMITSKNGNIDIIKLLLEKEGIDINAKNNKGMTAILLAADFGMKNMVDFLSTIEGIEYDKEKADKLILNPQQKHLRRNLRNVIFNKVDHCSAEQTGRDYLNDRSYFLCLTCKILPPYSICRECARVCHKGHHMMEIELTNNQGFFCDCGVGDCVLECKLMHTHKHKKETDE